MRSDKISTDVHTSSLLAEAGSTAPPGASATIKSTVLATLHRPSKSCAHCRILLAGWRCSKCGDTELRSERTDDANRHYFSERVILIPRTSMSMLSNDVLDHFAHAVKILSSDQLLANSASKGRINQHKAFQHNFNSRNVI